MDNNLGKLLNNFRELNNLSLREFATQIGISHTYLQKLENGVDPRSGNPVSPTIETLKLISERLNVSLDELLLICGYVKSKTTFDEETGSSITNYYPSISKYEFELINKYRMLDEKAKHTINTILDVEYTRCNSED